MMASCVGEISTSVIAVL